MFAARKDHTTLAIAPTLEGFCRGRAVSFVYAANRTRHVWDVPLSDHGGHTINISGVGLNRGRAGIRGIVLAVAGVGGGSACGKKF